MRIEVSHLTKRFGKTVALSDLSFILSPGKVTGLIGPNGAGKSTLLRLMAGRDFPDEGDITYDSLSACDYPERLGRLVGMMPDSLPEYRLWQVQDYLEFLARAVGWQGDERGRRLKEVMEFTQLGELRTRRLNELSKGMKQRVSLARALLADAPLLLLDEPAAGLDPRARIELRECIRKIAEAGKTILFSSHILTELEDMCDDVLILEQGRLQRHGALADLEGMAAPSAAPEGAAPTPRQITLEFQTLSPEVHLKLAQLPHFSGQEVKGGRGIVVTLDGTGQDVDEFMAAAFAAHLPIVSFQRRGRNLETLFMDTTEGKVQ